MRRPRPHAGVSLDRYREVSSSTEGTLSLGTAFSNSLFVVLLSTAIVMLLAIPAAYALAIRPVPKWRDVLFFFISTKFLPVVASIFPIYVLLPRSWNLIGTRTILVVLYTAINLPLAVWMMRSFFVGGATRADRSSADRRHASYDQRAR